MLSLPKQLPKQHKVKFGEEVDLVTGLKFVRLIINIFSRVQNILIFPMTQGLYVSADDYSVRLAMLNKKLGKEVELD